MHYKTVRACVTCGYCGSDENGLIRDPMYGVICPDCLEEYDELDRTIDLSSFEEDKRRRLAEQQEY